MDQGRVRALNGAPLTMTAERQRWYGPVAAGSGSADGGEVNLSGSITATVLPVFSLASGRSFNLGPGGAWASFGSTNVPLEVSTRGTGTVRTWGGIVAPQVTLESGQEVALERGGSVTGTGPGDAVVIAAGEHFFNANARSAVAATDRGARWLIYVNRLDNFAEPGNTEPGPHAHNLYDRSYAAYPPPSLGEFAGNRIVYAGQPTLTLTADDKTKTYGTTVPLTYSASGLRSGDSLTDIVGGPVVLTSAGQPVTAFVGPYVIDVAAGLSNIGYALVLVDGTLTVDPAALTIVADDAGKTYGQALSFAGTEFKASGLVNGDTVASVNLASAGAPAAAVVGRYAVAATDARGSGLANYTIAYVDGTLMVDPAALTIIADDAGKTYGQTLGFAGTEFTASGLVNSDTVASVDLASAGAPAAAGVGRYAIAATAARGSGLANYTIAYTDGILTVDPAALMIPATMRRGPRASRIRPSPPVTQASCWVKDRGTSAETSPSQHPRRRTARRATTASHRVVRRAGTTTSRSSTAS